MAIFRLLLSKVVPNNHFFRSLFILVSGTSIAQMIPVLISPILTRIYSPQDFGVLAMFMALTNTFGAIANGRYEAAIILPEKDEEALNIAAVGFVFSICLSALLYLFIFLFHDRIVSLLQNDHMTYWLYLFPLSIVLIGLNDLLNHYNLRFKNYKSISSSNVIRSLTQASVQLGIGFLKPGEFGLVGGQFLSYVMGNRTLAKQVLFQKELFPSVKASVMIDLGKKYANFPKFSLWARLANTLAQNLINVIISTLYSASTLGFYSLVNRILGFPTAIVGDSIGQIFMREACDEKNRTGKATKILKTTAVRLVAISLPFFSILYFFVEDLVAFVFGEGWRVTGTYAKILIPMFFIRFITVPVMAVLNLFDKQRISLMWQAGFLTLVAAVFIVSKILALGMEAFLALLNWTLLVHYLILLAVVFKISQGNTKEERYEG